MNKYRPWKRVGRYLRVRPKKRDQRRWSNMPVFYFGRAGQQTRKVVARIRNINWRAYRLSILFTALGAMLYGLEWAVLLGYLPRMIDSYRTSRVLCGAADTALLIAIFLAAGKTRRFGD